ncbi:MAG: bifunctional hydroxymethylpyrimidine kinase/phosphomethylpyrimidine kinase [Promethearchaeota archaeon]
MTNFCLTIAGADPTSGAGIQADIRTFDRCGVHPFSVITAITYQSATEFHGYKSLSDTLDLQLDAILSVYPIKYVKIGMIPDVQALDIIVDYIKRENLHVIYDPVSISSAGERLSSEGLELEIEKSLFPHLKIITPNLSEAEFYSSTNLRNLRLENEHKLKEATEILIEKMFTIKGKEKGEKAVIIKGGLIDKNYIYDLLCYRNNLKLEFKLFKKRKLNLKKNIHGTGCVFSSAITAFLAQGNPILKAIEKAENFFDEKFQKFVNLPDNGKIIDLSYSEKEIFVINQIKEIYNFISSSKKFVKLIPEVRTNISGSLPNAINKEDIAGIDGRITIVNGYPKASGDIKFGASDHTARLLLSAKEYDNSINFVVNLRYEEKYIKEIQTYTDLISYEFLRETQPDKVRMREHSTMQWLIKDSIDKFGNIPDIIWDKGAVGKEPIIRVFAKNSKEMIQKIEKIINLIDTID